MAKLKFDRKINMQLKHREAITVPEDEVWKVVIPIGPDSPYAPDNAITHINSVKVCSPAYGSSGNQSGGNLLGGTYVLGGGAILSVNKDGARTFITGIAFKIIN